MLNVVWQYLLQPGRGLTGAEVNQIHIHGGSALLEVGLKGDRNVQYFGDIIFRDER